MPPAVSASPQVAAAMSPATSSYIEWPAIWAGAVLATAVSFVLFTFGSGVGLSMISPEPGEGVSLRWFTIAAGLWFVWVVVTSFAAGGYLTGRMRRRTGDGNEDEVETRDGAHGLVVWASGTLIATVLAASGVSGIVGGVTATVGGAAGTVAEAMEDEIDHYAGLALRSETGTIVDNPEVRAEIGRILARSVAMGELAEADRTYLGRIVATETGDDPAQVEARIDAAVAEFETARQEAVDAIDQARVASIIGAFAIAATLLIAAACAYLAAVFGGKHRDENTAFRSFGR